MCFILLLHVTIHLCFLQNDLQPLDLGEEDFSMALPRSGAMTANGLPYPSFHPARYSALLDTACSDADSVLPTYESTYSSQDKNESVASSTLLTSGNDFPIFTSESGSEL